MKKDEITIGGTYLAKVSDKVVPVRVDAENRNGGWNATNLMSGKTVRIKSAQRFRCPANHDGSAQTEAEVQASTEATAEETNPKPTGRAKKNRLGRGTNNTWTDELSNPEAPVEAPAADTPTSEAGSAEPSEAPATATDAVVAPEAVPAPTVEADAPSKKLSALDAAARVLAEEGRPMNCQEMIEVMATKGYWHSPGGKTPAATLYAAILREQKVKGDQTRFAKAERGKFTRVR